MISVLGCEFSVVGYFASPSRLLPEGLGFIVRGLAFNVSLNDEILSQARDDD